MNKGAKKLIFSCSLFSFQYSQIIQAMWVALIGLLNCSIGLYYKWFFISTFRTSFIYLTFLDLSSAALDSSSLLQILWLEDMRTNGHLNWQICSWSVEHILWHHWYALPTKLQHMPAQARSSRDLQPVLSWVEFNNPTHLPSHEIFTSSSTWKR